MHRRFDLPLRSHACNARLIMEIVYIEAVLMDNGELIHFGKTLGFITDKQRGLLDARATKMTKGSEPVVAIKGSEKETA